MFYEVLEILRLIKDAYTCTRVDDCFEPRIQTVLWGNKYLGVSMLQGYYYLTSFVHFQALTWEVLLHVGCIPYWNLICLCDSCSNITHVKCSWRCIHHINRTLTIIHFIIKYHIKSSRHGSGPVCSIIDELVALSDITSMLAYERCYLTSRVMQFTQ